MKNIVIVGAGTAGVLSAAICRKIWKYNANISVYYNSKKKCIGVGESVAPGIIEFLDNTLGLSIEDILRISGTTLKLGIRYKNWIPDDEYFHGLDELPEGDHDDHGYSCGNALYSLPKDLYNGGMNFQVSTGTKVPDKDLSDYIPTIHIDTQEFIDHIIELLKKDDMYGKPVNFIDDKIEKVNIDNNIITSIECKNSGEVTADCFIDASGFERILFKHLDPKWISLSKVFPVDRAIAYNINLKESDDIRSYTLAEATDNGWIWGIPIGRTYSTGYIYSSKFTSEQEAKEKYNNWLLKNYNTELKFERIIEFNPGYYEDAFIGNCKAIGLSSGFIEPLEATGLQLVINQLEDFARQNISLKNLKHDVRVLNHRNRIDYDHIARFVALHYATNRTDSEFWKYMTNNKTQFVKDFEEKCNEDFLDIGDEDDILESWTIDSWIQIAHGLNMFNKESLSEFIDSKNWNIRTIGGEEHDNKKDILKTYKKMYAKIEKKKKSYNWISHQQFLESLQNNADK